ncbi:MAG: sodium:calcium antiporter [Planctomycetaceae bacterium]|jgi:cation:H+ antiporter|nr:sodium:calcium antiporter [Planctomycetaceae bacterium]MBT6153783.1 sodium:calcium antiporter [Planctomycetaceae bacterium]MBT6485043.1 sodium:calcium antiporter [Planctomycetaceae bacterium]MBT6495540.1 sodium:calcium antiporter [Planctomycetaceae bacterium]
MEMLIAEFVGLSLAIVIAGSFLARDADRIGELTGLGRTLTGIVLLAAATSLPELVVGCQAALIDAPNLAVGDLLGSCLFNLLILAVLDLTHRERGRMLSRSAAAHALSATASIVLTAIVLMALLVDVPWPIQRVSAGSVAILVAYLMSLRLVYFDEQTVRQAIADVAVASEEERAATKSLRRAAIGFVAATIVILFAAPRLATTANELADVSGLGGTIVGTIFVALVTSLPEVSTTVAAVRMRAFDMAVGNILGSNAFNIVTLVAVDLFYPAPLLAAANISATHALTAAAVILVTAVVAMGLLYRAEKRYWIVEPDALLVILLIVGSFCLVYFR